MDFVSNLMLEMEEKLNLLNWEIDGVHIWQSARTQIYEKIINLLYNDNYKDDLKTNKVTVDFISKIKRIIINSLILNPYFDFRKTNILIFESGRKELVDGECIDIHTKYLCDHFDEFNKKYTVYSVESPLRKIKDSFLFNKSLDFINLNAKVLSLLFRKNFSSEDNLIINKIENEFKSRIGVELDIYSILKSEFKRFKSQYISYKLLFNIKQPSDIYLTNSSYKAPLIKAAKDCHILVNELQHGLIIKEGIIANFPNSKEDNVEYFPDRFYIWKDLNMCSVKLPLSIGNIFYFPNMHLEYMKKKYNINVKNPKQITIISQPLIGNQIFKYIISNIQKMQDWHFLYKLHPEENLKDYQSYDYKINALSNFDFVINEMSIYKLMSESKYVIGVFSTALFEAKYFDCKIILLDIPGVEFAELLVNQKNVIKIKLSEDLNEQVLLLSD